MDTYILGIESSCDETAASVVKNGREVLSNVINTQIDIHKKYGGVVPEIASRKHIENIDAVIDEALLQAGKTLDEIDAIAVTNGPGLVGALLVGVSEAKAIAYAKGLPLVPVHHIRGHITANFLAHKDLEPPFVCLVASGGHSHIVNVKSYTDFEVLGRTRDDAAGEAFDKAARVLGLPYPGGAMMDKLAAEGDKNRFPFTVSKVHDCPFDFSFSGLKTAVINLVHTMEMRGEEIDGALKADIAASFTKAAVKTVSRGVEALYAEGEKLPLVLSGGVAANSHLRAALKAFTEKIGVDFYVPPLSLCGDNALMIAAQGYYEFSEGKRAPLDQNAFACMEA